MALNEEYRLIPVKLHEALLTSPSTKAAAATYMIATGGLTLSQTDIEKAIDIVINDLFDRLIISNNTYSSLLSRHQAVGSEKALRVLSAVVKILLIKREIEINNDLIALAEAEWVGLTQGQKDGIPNIKAIADAGVSCLQLANLNLQKRLDSLNSLRTLG